MKVRELIAELQKCPPEMNVEVWADEEDDFVPVTQVIYEDGCPEIHLHTGAPVAMVPADPEG
jgi:hypothetical protein